MRGLWVLHDGSMRDDEDDDDDDDDDNPCALRQLNELLDGCPISQDAQCFRPAWPTPTLDLKL